MGKKIGIVLIIWVCVIVSYIIITAAMPAIDEFVDEAVASENISSYAGAEDALTSAPLWIYVMPALIGGVATVIILKS